MAVTTGNMLSLGWWIDTDVSVDYPAEADVQESVSYGDGAYTGTFVVPAESDVRFGTTYGAAAEYTGTLPAASSTGGDGTLRFGEDGLRSRLLSDATIVGLVGAQIYPVGGVPQGVEMPYGQYQRVDAQHWASISSALGLAQIRVQYDWYSDSLTEVRTLAERARIMLESYAGTISVDGQNVVVRVCRLVDEDSYGEQVGDGADATLWRWRQDYQVVYTEATS